MSIAIQRLAIRSIGLALLLGSTVLGCQLESTTVPDPVTPVEPGRISVVPTPSEISPQWVLVRPDGEVLDGSGSVTLENMPVGKYELTWAPVSGWQSPTPNPLLGLLTSGGAITFSAGYVEITVETGSVAIETEPDEIRAPWEVTGPNGFLFEGNGDRVLTGREPGLYEVTFGDMVNYATAGPVQGTLVPGGHLDLAGSYIYQAPPSEGTILLDISPDSMNAPWTITGPNGFSDQGVGDASLAGIPVGDYTIRFEPVAGWDSPNPSIILHSLSDGELFVASGTYIFSRDRDANAPAITGVTGSLTNGGAVTIAGTSFGTHTLEIESSLGPDGWIESNSVRTPVSSLQGAPDWRSFSASAPAYIDNSRSHSGSKSINGSIDRSADGDWNKILYYTKQSKFDRIYATWWVYFDPIKYSSDLQWKMWRVGDEGGNSVASDNCASLLQASHWAPGYNATAYTTIFHCQLGCEWPSQTQCYQHVEPDPWYAPENNEPYNYKWHSRGGRVPILDHLPRKAEWARAEFFLEASDVDTPNGRYWLTINRPGESRRVIDNWVTGLITHRSNCCSGSSSQWENFVLQGYIDDNGGPFADEEVQLFYDDIYLQFGTAARVELGNDAEFEGCTQLEVQEVVSWSEGQIQISLNRGGFSSGQQVWLFVIGEDGQVSNGRGITIQ